jgi:hypothetical protein
MRGYKTKFSEVFSYRPMRFRIASASLVFAAALACVAQEDRSAARPGTPVTAEGKDSKPQQRKSDKDQKLTSPESDRKKQITDESAQLLDMALALKAEVDKTTKDTLSIDVIKKADQIEKLAKSVKEKMKQSSGS